MMTETGTHETSSVTQRISYFKNTGHVCLLLPFVLAVASAAQTSGTPIAPGSTMTVSVTGGPGNKGDWVGLFRVGAAEDGFNTLAWCFLSGTHDYPSNDDMRLATFPFVLPKALPAGRYEFRFYASDNYFTRLATGAPFTVGAGGSETPEITATPTHVKAGDSVTISVSGASGINDWVGFYRIGAPSDDIHQLAWSYLNGTQKSPSGKLTKATFTFVVPGGLSHMPGGEYEFRLFSNDDFKEPLASTQMITVGSGAQLQSVLLK